MITKKLELIFLSGIFLLNSSIKCQEINIGDTLSRTQLIINDSTTALIPTKLKGKWILLDFWSHTCISCIQSFPKLDSFQKEFGESLQIVLVNRESKDSTDRFFEKRKKIKRPNVLFVSGDTSLSSRLPHSAVPYHAWIDSNEIVRYLTYGENTTREKIKNLLSGEIFALTSYKRTKYISTLLDTSWLHSLKYFSYLATCNPAFHLQAEKIACYEQISFNCSSALELYIYAFKEGNKYQFNKPGRVILEVINPLIYRKPDDKEILESWYTSYSYNYHLFLPEEQKKRIYAIMQTDLRRYFHLNATVEKRKVKCLVLKRTSNNNKLKSKGGTTVNEFYFADESFVRIDSLRFMKNQPYNIFSKAFSNYLEFNLETSFIDSTGFTGNIDIAFTGAAVDSKDLYRIRSELNRYDLELKEEEILFDVLVLKE
jgi:thiol-disulfide isomerase/thioredoxin